MPQSTINHRPFEEKRFKFMPISPQPPSGKKEVSEPVLSSLKGEKPNLGDHQL
jgi:hypothetical protein